MTIKEVYEFAKSMNMENSDLYFDYCNSEFAVKSVFAFANMTEEIKKIVLSDYESLK